MPEFRSVRLVECLCGKFAGSLTGLLCHQERVHKRVPSVRVVIPPIEAVDYVIVDPAQVCPNGHQRTPENTYIWATGQTCKPCHLESQRRWRLANA